HAGQPVRPGTDLEDEPEPQRLHDARREQPVVLAVDHVRPDHRGREPAPRHLFPQHFLGAALALRVKVVGLEFAERGVLVHARPPPPPPPPPPPATTARAVRHAAPPQAGPPRPPPRGRRACPPAAPPPCPAP